MRLSRDAGSLVPTIISRSIGCVKDWVSRHIWPPTPGAGIVEVGLYRMTSDGLPRVHVNFLGHSSTHSLLLDTGSRRTLLAVDSQLVEPSGFVSRDDGSQLSVGHDGHSADITILGRVADTVQLMKLNGDPAFDYRTEVHLVEPFAGADFRRGLLGAGRTSHFAEAAGTFTYIPRSAWWSLRGSPMGILRIGDRSEENLRRLCMAGSRLAWIPLDIWTSPDHWIVPGAVSTVGSEWSHHVLWAIDTGAGGIYVPHELYAELVAAIQDTGSAVSPHNPTEQAEISDCFDYRVRFPSLRFVIGCGTNAVVVDLPPADYIDDYSSGRCRLAVDPMGVEALPGVRLLGLPFLDRMVTTFDRETDRVGFCHVN